MSGCHVDFVCAPARTKRHTQWSVPVVRVGELAARIMCGSGLAVCARTTRTTPSPCTMPPSTKQHRSIALMNTLQDDISRTSLQALCQHQALPKHHVDKHKRKPRRRRAVLKTHEHSTCRRCRRGRHCCRCRCCCRCGRRSDIGALCRCQWSRHRSSCARGSPAPA